jgi:hemolysin-activating ACP:hemolysin acyltransferase
MLNTSLNAHVGPDEPISQGRALLASFGEIVTLMTRSPRHRHAFLAELDWLVAPAIATRQYSVAHAQTGQAGIAAPVAAILWACVSPEIDARLVAAGERPRLRPSEWRSGEIPWLIDAIGDPRATAVLLKRLTETRFAEAGVKTVVQKDGKHVVEVARCVPKSTDDLGQSLNDEGKEEALL